jgi:hypothetical protein
MSLAFCREVGLMPKERFGHHEGWRQKCGSRQNSYSTECFGAPRQNTFFSSQHDFVA